MQKSMKITTIEASPKKPTVVRVAAYARVSSDKDAAFHSLAAQTSYYEGYIASHPGWELVEIYSDNGISGTLLNRPEFQRMLEDCRNGKIDLIVTKSVTRFARNTVALLTAIRELKSLGVDVFFEKEEMHSVSADGELLLTLLALFAEEEARSASENQKWRIKKKYEQGIPVIGRVYGYQLVDGKYVIVPEQAEVVRRIFKMYLNGAGLSVIAKTLNSEGIPCSTGGEWSVQGIHNLLRNEKYAGNLLLQKSFVEDFRTKKQVMNKGERRKYYVENAHEPIIDPAAFDETQKVLLQRKEEYDFGRAATGNKPRHLFCGLIRCDKCGHLYQHTYNNKRPTWTCPRFRMFGRKGCISGQIREDTLIAETKRVLGLPDAMELTPAFLKEQIVEILVPKHQHLIYHLTDGRKVEVFWELVSKKSVWTEERRERARQNALKMWRKRKEEV